MKTIFIPAVRVFGMLTLATGIVYPLAVTGVVNLVAPRQANGSVLTSPAGAAVGSTLIAQKFTEPKYFWPRPSAGDFATVASGTSNLGPTASALRDAIAERAKALREAHGLTGDAPVPEELLMASGSGLDPHLSPETVRFQFERVAKARGFNAAQRDALQTAIAAATEAPQLGCLGQERINVLKLNLALDQIH